MKTHDPLQEAFQLVQNLNATSDHAIEQKWQIVSLLRESIERRGYSRLKMARLSREVAKKNKRLAKIAKNHD